MRLVAKSAALVVVSRRVSWSGSFIDVSRDGQRFCQTYRGLIKVHFKQLTREAD